MKKRRPALFLTIFLPVVLWGQTPRRDLHYEAGTKKLALLVGNETYPKWPLRNPVNDAKAMDETLRENGFETEVLLNANLRTLERTIDKFVARLHPGDVALFFYAGHGIQLNGENYLVPVDFDAQDEADAKYVSYSASRVQDKIEASGARLSLLIFDACRNNPFHASRGAGGGLAAMNTGKGTLVALATSPGKTADDNVNGRNGLFTSHLVSALREPGLSLDQVFNRVREKVYAESGQRQLPWTVSSVIGEFYFKSGVQTLQQAVQPVPQTPPPPPRAVEAVAALAPRQRPGPDMSEKATEANMAYNRGDFQRAIQGAQEVLRIQGQNKEALFALAASYYRTQQYDLFVGPAVEALKMGGMLPFQLAHHHTLSGIHGSLLKISAAEIGFDPLGGAGCTQKKFQHPMNTLISANVTTTVNSEVFLHLRIKDEQNKLHTYNFADPESTVEATKGLPIVRSPAKASRQLQAIAAVIMQVRNP